MRISNHFTPRGRFGGVAEGFIGRVISDPHKGTILVDFANEGGPQHFGISLSYDEARDLILRLLGHLPVAPDAEIIGREEGGRHVCHVHCAPGDHCTTIGSHRLHSSL